MHRESIDIFEVYREPGDPTYSVRVGNSLYEMNEHPTSPNGVNMYLGEWSEFEEYYADKKPLENIPTILVAGWISRSNVVEETK